MKPLYKRLMVMLAVAAVLLLPLAANADIILVAPGDFTGSRSTDSGEGISGFGLWAGVTDNVPNFSLSWIIEAPGTGAGQSGGNYWSYTYTLTAPTKAISHFILQVSSSITNENLSEIIFNSIPGIATDGVVLWDNTVGNSNPGLPSPGIYGIKWDLTGTSATITFDSLNGPIWGDFYSKDGNNQPQSYAYNTGFSVFGPPTGTTDFTNWIPVVDTFGVNVPVPASALLLGSGLLALGLIGWRRREKKA